ncbi:MAG: hypothetical protein Q4A97_01675 [Comamonadaceae bacterium]|nr:hypothetical protein [Comamonadaceae bacterium]
MSKTACTPCGPGGPSPAITVKRGDSIDWHCRVQAGGPGGGLPLDITGWSIACQLRSVQRNAAARLVHAFAPAIVNAAAGQYRLSASNAQTAAWPAGLAALDVRYTDATGRVMHTETVAVLVCEAITR